MSGGAPRLFGSAESIVGNHFPPVVTVIGE